MSDETPTLGAFGRMPKIGEPVFLVMVRCGCTDRWWAQPEGGCFPRCQSCGEEARWIGWTPDLEEGEASWTARKANSLGIVGTVLGELDALGVAQHRRDGASLAWADQAARMLKEMDHDRALDVLCEMRAEIDSLRRIVESQSTLIEALNQALDAESAS
jgi:hypothetical protein